MGKTTLALNIAEYASADPHNKKKTPSVIFSLEMGKEELVMRFLASIAKVDFGRMRTGRFQDSDWPRLTRAAGIDNGTAPQHGLAGLRVLVAEDTAFFREAVRRGLKDLVKTLDIAADGEDAWQLLQKGAYDLLITDLEMPRLNGFELTTRIRADARFKDLPVIALSARDNPDFQERARLAGISRYETKLDRERLCLAITTVLHLE